MKSFSPVSKTKDSFGLYYDQQFPDSAEARVKTKAMTYFSKKNLRDYNQNESLREGNLKYSMPMYGTNTVSLNPALGANTILTTSNFSNSDYKDSGKKSKPQLLKWHSSQMKYKIKKNSENNPKSTAVKYCTNYSSKRPKSAKGVGSYVSSSKYRQAENQSSSIYKYSMHKASISSKYTSSSKKKHGNTSQMRKTQPIKNITTKTK